MSVASARTRPASRPQRIREEAAAPELLVVEGRVPRRGVILTAIIVLSMLVFTVVVPVLVHTRMAQTAFAIREQQLVLNELDAARWTMQAELERRSSPIALEEAARAQGMVPAGPTGFIRLATGTVEGGVPAR